MELIIIACVLGYLAVSPDKKSLAVSRGLAGMAWGGITGKPPKAKKEKNRSPRQLAMLEGWRSGVASARERREAGRDLWSRGTRGAGRVAGGTASLARGIHGTVQARRARSADATTAITDPAPDSDVSSAVVDQDGKPATVVADGPEPRVVSTEDGSTDLQFGDDPTDPTGTKLCAACKGVPVQDGKICGQCQFRQMLRNRHHDEQDEPIVVPGPEQRDCRNCPGDGRHWYDQHCSLRVGPWPRIESPDVMVLNDKDPFGPPSYEGDPADAHLKLDPGIYQTTDPDVALVVSDHDSKLQRRVPLSADDAAPGINFPDARNDATDSNLGSDFHQSTTTAPIGETLMSLAKTELLNLDDLAKEVKAVETAIAGIAESLEIARKWGVDLPERYSAAGWGTAGLDNAVTTMSETLGQLKFPAVSEAMGNIQAEITKARGVGEVVSQHQARGKTEAFAGQ